ncbi:hypothetical protein BC829DRAFT_439187 [Chytridium lagenaria]|nr:hypothetical protein BC829DRAFT_439187 [Chytridium lagenaria]
MSFYNGHDAREYVSTSTESYKKHDPTTTQTQDFMSERDQYLKNKLKANHGGDWWSQSQREEQVQQSRGGHGGPSGSNYGISFAPQSDPQHDDNWLAHRRKKAVSTDDGKSYNILTGMESSQGVSGRYDPSRSAKRVSADKLEVARNEAMGRVYNIISNV